MLRKNLYRIFVVGVLALAFGCSAIPVTPDNQQTYATIGYDLGELLGAAVQLTNYNDDLQAWRTGSLIPFRDKWCMDESNTAIPTFEADEVLVAGIGKFIDNLAHLSSPISQVVILALRDAFNIISHVVITPGTTVLTVPQGYVACQTNDGVLVGSAPFLYKGMSKAGGKALLESKAEVLEARIRQLQSTPFYKRWGFKK